MSAASMQTAPLTERARIAFDFVVNDEEMDGFARISGDRNAVHIDDAHARARGFQGRVVYCGLLIAKLSRLVGMELPTTECLCTGVRFDFRRPLYVGEPARIEAEIIHVSEAVRAATIAVRISAGERLLAKGVVEVTYFDERS